MRLYVRPGHSRGAECTARTGQNREAVSCHVGALPGAAPIHIREVAETAGRVTKASRFSERMENHFMYGSNERLPEHIVGLGRRA